MSRVSPTAITSPTATPVPAQRGGSVFSHIRFGDRVHSPMARRAHVDYLVALEKLEVLRYAHFVKPGGTIVVNDHG